MNILNFEEFIAAIEVLIIWVLNIGKWLILAGLVLILFAFLLKFIILFMKKNNIKITFE